MTANSKARRTTRELHLGRMKMWEASISNHDRYMDKKTGAFAESYTEARVCPACKDDDARFMFQKSGGHYHACNKCGMVYLNPALKDEFISEYYQMNHAVQGEIVAEDLDFYKNLYLKGLDQLSAIAAKGQRILDVGCSTGIFLDIAREKGWQTYGLELNKQELVLARSKGHQVVEGMIDTAALDETFDAITLWDVFEHIKDGEKFLIDARRFLVPNGLVFIQSPSRDALAARILQSACNMFDGLEHVNLYGRKSLEIIAKTTGYEVVSFETVIAEAGVINNYLDYQDPYLGPLVDSESVMGMTVKQILDTGIGYKFQATLREKTKKPL